MAQVIKYQTNIPNTSSYKSNFDIRQSLSCQVTIIKMTLICFLEFRSYICAFQHIKRMYKLHIAEFLSYDPKKYY